MDLIGIGYKLFTLMMDHDQCATDEQRIKEIADVVEDLSSASVMIHGFEEAWDPKELDHVTRKEFKKEMSEYKEELKKAADAAAEEMAKITGGLNIPGIGDALSQLGLGGPTPS